MIIDAHTHIFSPHVIEQREQYCSSDGCFRLLYSKPNSKMCSAEELILAMDSREISRSVIQNIGWESHEMCMRSNDYILESIAKYPHRLIGFCSIQPLAGEKALAELERCYKGGVQGVGELRPDVQGFDLCDINLMNPIVNHMIKRGLLLSLHASEPVGHQYPGKGTMVPGILCRFIQAHQELEVILAHLGGGLPFYELIPEVKDILSNTYYDTAATPFLYSSDVYSALTRIVSLKKIIFGSDYPLLDPIRVSDHIKSAGLSNIELDNILYNNSAKIFGC